MIEILKPSTEVVKVAVLGGGFGSMAAVWGLLNSPDAERYEITIYQMGWRLGGKAASGRNRERGDRIESRGLQVWSGMYENAFRMMRQVYEELDRSPDEPLSTWYDERHPEHSAFLPQDSVTLTEFHDGRWEAWDLHFPRNGELPGSGKPLPEPRAFLEAILQQMLASISDADYLWDLQWAERSRNAPAIARSVLAAGRELLGSTLLFRSARATSHTVSHWLLARHLEDALQAARAMPAQPRPRTDNETAAILRPLREFMELFERSFEGQLDSHTELRRLHVLLDLGVAAIHGLLGDRLFEKGFDAIDQEDFAAWLGRHGASRSSLESPVIRAAYDLFYASPDGQDGSRSMSAATGLRTALRQLFSFRGSFLWKLQAGAGDAIFAPLYQLLDSRKNVKFEFFHKLDELCVELDGEATQQVQSIKLARQVNLLDPTRPYDPLCRVKGLPCWPSEPDYEQLDEKQARTLREYAIDLESAWSPWPAREMIELQRGRDFDAVVLGIPPAALAKCTPELERHVSGWSELLSLPSVQTQIMQLWFDEGLDRLGWERSPTLGSAYANPFKSWANMDELLRREEWERVGQAPRSLIYFCGAVADATPIPDFQAHWFPEEQRQRSAEECASWLMGNVGPLWPRAAQLGTAELDWSKLTGLRPGLSGQHRLRDQFWHINIDPSARQVLSLPGTARLRPRSHGSGVRNLYLAGDWLDTGLNIGCAEAAVMGGLQASRAISGWPREILGDEDFIVSKRARRTRVKLRAL